MLIGRARVWRRIAPERSADTLNRVVLYSTCRRRCCCTASQLELNVALLGAIAASGHGGCISLRPNRAVAPVPYAVARHPSLLQIDHKQLRQAAARLGTMH